MKFTIMQFNDRFPTSDACLEEIKQLRYADYTCASCGRHDQLSKVSGRPVYACNCGKQVHPLAGTIFHKSSTDLRTWFYAMYLMVQTRAGISAMQLMRETGVTYKTAWRIFKQIRSLMEDNDGDLLTGVVEVDEAYVGGVKRDMRGKRATGAKHAIMGMVERGGRVRVQVIPDDRGETMLPIIQHNISKEAWVQSDQHPSYRALGRMGYMHDSVNHSRQFVTAEGVHTNTIEGFWSTFKNGFRGVYRHAGSGYIQSYANEYAWRYSHRKSNVPMFELLLTTITR
jgi:transposase